MDATKKAAKTINPNVGFHQLRLGMAVDEVIEIMGRANEINEVEPMKTIKMYDDGKVEIEDAQDSGLTETTMRYNDLVVYFKGGRLTCISVVPRPGLVMRGEEVPHALIPLLSFLKQRSKLNLRFPFQQSAVFVDLGLVVYSHVDIDIIAGVEKKTSSTRIAICDFPITKAYLKYFYKCEERPLDSVDGIDSFVQRIGLQLEQWSNLTEEELDEYLDSVADGFVDGRSAGDLGYIVGEID